MSAAESVLATWSEIRAWLKEARPELFADLRPAVGEDGLSALVALDLPDEWRAWWGANDGAGLVLFEGWSWLPVQGVVDSVVAEHEALLEMAVQLVSEPPPRAEGPVEALWGHRKWIPFAVDFSGRFLCVDLAPKAGGTVGQVIVIDDAERRVLYDGLHSMLSDCLLRMEMGVHPDDDPDPESEEWDGEAVAEAAPTGPVAASFEKAQLPPRPKLPTEPPKPAHIWDAPEVRGQAVAADGGARVEVSLSESERSEGATVFVSQLSGDIVGVRVPAGAWDGARLVLTGLGGEGQDLMLVVAAAS
jgi:cell wall assembly regulator SMI1